MNQPAVSTSRSRHHRGARANRTNDSKLRLAEILEVRRLLTTYYVDTNNAAASDQNAGTSITAPLKTISQALDLAAIANTYSPTVQSNKILIRGGVYREQPYVWQSDGGVSAIDRTVISAYVNPVTGQYEPVYIDAADPTTGTWIQNGTSNIWYLNNFTTETAGIWVDWTPANDGATLQQIGSYNAGYPDYRKIVGSGISDMYPGTYYGDPADSRLYVWLTDGSNPNLHTIEYANRSRAIYQPGNFVNNQYVYAAHVDFVGLNLRHDNPYDTVGQDPGCGMYTEGDDRLINCTMEWNAGAGVFLYGNAQMINCTADYNGRNGVLAQGEGFLISGGQFDYNYWRHQLDAGDAGIKVITANPILYGSIENAEIAYNYGKGIWYDTCFANTSINDVTGNYIHDNQGDGLDLEASANFLVANNIIANNQADGIQVDAVENAQIDNNTIVGNHGLGAIELDGGSRYEGYGYPGIIATIGDSVENNIIANNFSVYDFDIPTVTNENNTADYNLFYRRGGPLKFTDGGTYLGWYSTPYTLAGWQSVSGQDAHSIVADPLFVPGGTGALAYEIGLNSPAVAVGANLSSFFTTDYTGGLRLANTPFDLGALQSVAATTGTAGPVVVNTDPDVWVDDQLPDNSATTPPDNTGNIGENRFWAWENSNTYSGAAALDSTVIAGAHRQYFNGANPRSVGSNDLLFAYVWIDPANLPQQIMLEWQDSTGSWAHQAYWGASLIGAGVDGSVAGQYMGALPTAGQWVKLAVPAATVGLAGASITGFSFDLYNGRALLDKIGNGANTASITGTVFQDNNGNGMQDTGETGLAGRTVFVDVNGNGVDDPGEPSTITSSTGSYAFNNLVAGTYVIRQVVPTGYVSSTAPGIVSSLVVANGAAVQQSFGQFPTAFTSLSSTDNYVVGLSADQSLVLIWEAEPETAPASYTIATSQLTSLSFSAGGFNSPLSVDCSNGVPLSAGGISFDGATAAASLSIIGSPTVGTTFNASSNAVTINGSAVNFAHVGSIIFTGGSGADVLNQLGGPAAITFNGVTGADTVNVRSGSITFAGDPQAATAALTVNVSTGAAVTFSRGDSTSGIRVFHLSSLNLAANASAILAQSVDSPDRMLLMLGTLTFAGTISAPAGTLNVADNEIILQTGSATALNGALAEGFGKGTWAGPGGIVSSAAHANASYLTAVGMATGITGLFDGQTVAAGNIILKYTYYGDATLDGKVDGSDYSRIDTAALNGATGWYNGDFNYDGVINGSDYTLIDNAFNTQPSSPAALFAVQPAKALAASIVAASTSTTKVTTLSTPANSALPDILARGDYMFTDPSMGSQQNSLLQDSWNIDAVLDDSHGRGSAGIDV